MAKSPSRIVFVTPGGVEAGGGMGRITGYIVDELARRGHGRDLVVLDPRGGGRALWTPWFLLLACMRLTLMIAAGQVAVVHVNTSERLSWPRKGVIVRLARLFGVPVVAHMHGADFIPYFDEGAAWERRWVRRTLELSQKVVVLGEDYRRHAIEAVGIAPGKLVKLHNAIPDVGTSPIAPRPARAGRPVRLLMLANISARKGADVLLEAAAALEAAGLPFHITFAGGGEIKAFQALAAAKGLAGRTEFLGWVDRERAHRLLAEADVMVLPSRAEGLPLAILEALALGTPIVTCPVGAIPEVLVDGETALIVPAGDAPALTAALRRLIEDETLARSLAQQGRRLYEQQFSVVRFCDRWLRLYGEVIDQAGRRRPGWAADGAAAALP
jgi:glycosyltransferase involved in cell wall biosynthesis